MYELERPALLSYAGRLEKYALEGDGYRCDACALVYDCNEGAHGEDCWLCHAYYAEATA